LAIFDKRLKSMIEITTARELRETTSCANSQTQNYRENVAREGFTREVSVVCDVFRTSRRFENRRLETKRQRNEVSGAFGDEF